MSGKIKKLINHVSGRTSALRLSKIERDAGLLQEKMSNLDVKLNAIDQLLQITKLWLPKPTSLWVFRPCDVRSHYYIKVV